MENDMELGGNIVLSGFREIPRAEFLVIKKIVGSYARKFSDHLEDYKSLSLYLKPVHRTEGSEKYEVHGKLLHKGDVNNIEVVDRNLFVAVDSVLKKLESEVF
jgi:hypothetical protein